MGKQVTPAVIGALVLGCAGAAYATPGRQGLGAWIAVTALLLLIAVGALIHHHRTRRPAHRR